MTQGRRNRFRTRLPNVVPDVRAGLSRSFGPIGARKFDATSRCNTGVVRANRKDADVGGGAQRFDTGVHARSKNELDDSTALDLRRAYHLELAIMFVASRALAVLPVTIGA